MADDIPSSVPSGDKFALVACDGHHDLSGELTLASGVRLCTEPPIGIGENWTKWLGSLRAEQLDKASLVLFVSAASKAPGVVDDENHALQERVDRMYFGLRLLGMYPYDDALTLNGANDDGRLSVRSIGRHEDVWQQGTRSVSVNPDVANRAETIAAGMQQVSSSSDFGRVKRGFAAWQRGIRDDRLSFRLHQFVRSLDGLLRTPPGQGRKRFVDRGQTLLGASDDHRTLLRELYTLRSGSEHLHEWDYGLEHLLEDERSPRGELRTFQAELIASEAFARVLSRDALLTHFGSDAGIDAFWALSPDERTALWGEPFDLRTAIQERYARA